MKRTNNEQRFPPTALTIIPPPRKPPYAVQVPAHIEKNDEGRDEIVIQTRSLFGRIAIAGRPFGELKPGQDVTVRIGLVNG